MTIKALILAGGRGKRLDKITPDLNKCMLPFNGKPLVTYSLENALLADVEEIVIVVGYRAEDIINHVGITFSEKRIKYVIQKEQKGLVDAIQCAREAIDGCSFMTFLGDEILVQPRHKEMLAAFTHSGAFVICGVTDVEDQQAISKTYAIIQDDGQTIYRLIEKPRAPLNHTMGTGNCIFSNGIFDYIEHTPINQSRGEKELPDLIQCAIDEGRLVKSFNIGTGYININTEADIAASEKLFEQLTEGEAI